MSSDSPVAPSGGMSRNARLGLAFFALYALVYVGFVAVCTFKYEWMGTIVFAGLNLAIVYGMGLIVLAVLLALLYAVLCTPAGDAEGVAADGRRWTQIDADNVNSPLL